MSEKYIRVTVEGLNGMIGKVIPFGAKGIVTEALPQGFYVSFYDSEPIYVPADQCVDWEPCHSCELLRINGIVTHEIGCPDAWRDEVKLCKWCGGKFIPEESHQDCCGHTCSMSYRNVSCDCEQCNPVE
jgi:hypothetical protein